MSQLSQSIFYEEIIFYFFGGTPSYVVREHMSKKCGRQMYTETTKEEPTI